MRTPRRRLIGLAVAHGQFDFFGRILEGVTRYAEHCPGWRFVPVAVEKGWLRSSNPPKLDGLLAALNTPAIVASLKQWRGPVVDIALMLPGLRYPFVRVDNGLVGRLALEHFQGLGLRQFAFVGPPQGLYSTIREEGFRVAVKAAGFHLHVFHMRRQAKQEVDFRIWPAHPQLLEWLRELPKPIGLFVPEDFLGFQLTEACRQIAIRVPDEIAILGVDNCELICGLSKPRLSSIILPTQRIGFEAAKLLDRLIEGRNTPRTQILLPPCGIEVRQSTDMLATDDREVAKAVRFVRENSHLPVRVADVLKAVPVGRRTLERRVRGFLGHSLGSEILRCHLDRAKRLLADSDLPVSQVARHSGFTSGRHLAVLFRKTFAMSATGFRIASRQETAAP